MGRPLLPRYAQKEISVYVIKKPGHPGFFNCGDLKLYLLSRFDTFGELLCRAEIEYEVVRQFLPPEKRRGVVGGEYVKRTELLDLPALTGDLDIPVIDVSCRYTTETDDHLRTYKRNLRTEIGEAALGFIGKRIAVLRRAAFDHVAYIDGFAVEPRFLEMIIEKPSRCADEGNALLVLLTPGAFTDEHDIGVRISVGNDDTVTVLAKAALRTAVEFTVKRIPIESEYCHYLLR